MKKEIKNKSEFEELVEQIGDCLEWYEQRNFNERVYKLYLANGERIDVVFSQKGIAHLLGIKTEYLKTTKLLKSKSSYDILKEICSDPYKIHKLVSEGHLNYKTFISCYANDKADNFKSNCGINDIGSIEFICPYIKQYSFITGMQQLEGDYYICYKRNEELLILGLKKDGNVYSPMTSRIINLEDAESKEFLNQLLTNQHITMLSSIIINDGINDSRKVFYNYDDKAKKLKTLQNYADEYDARVEVYSDYQYVLEKYNQLFALSKELDNILTFISAAMQAKCPIDLAKLQEKNVNLSDSMFEMIKSYNLSLEKELTSAGANIYAKQARDERDKLREDFAEIQNELASAVSINKELTEKNSLLEQENKKLKEENAAYDERETKIMRILTRENDKQNH